VSCPEKADDFIIELLSDHDKAAKYLPFSTKVQKDGQKWMPNKEENSKPNNLT
jgi:hypothetical protein